MMARVVIVGAVGALERLTYSVPAPIAELVEEHAARLGAADAWALAGAVSEAARRAYGPPAYVPFAMPGARGVPTMPGSRA